MKNIKHTIHRRAYMDQQPYQESLLRSQYNSAVHEAKKAKRHYAHDMEQLAAQSAPLNHYQCLALKGSRERFITTRQLMYMYRRELNKMTRKRKSCLHQYFVAKYEPGEDPQSDKYINVTFIDARSVAAVLQNVRSILELKSGTTIVVGKRMPVELNFDVEDGLDYIREEVKKRFGDDTFMEDVDPKAQEELQKSVDAVFKQWMKKHHYDLDNYLVADSDLHPIKYIVQEDYIEGPIPWEEAPW